MPPFDLDEAHSRYLDALLTSYAMLHLPIHSSEHQLPVQTIFQPLTLRHGPFSFENTALDRQDNASLQEQRDKTITAQNGSEALTKSPSRRMVVLGGPGMGKTTLLKALLQQAIHDAQTDNTAPIPLFVSLPDLARSGLTLQTYLPGILTELAIDGAYIHTLMEAINAGRAFLCMDSLDEVVPAQRPAMIALINREAMRCGGIWIIGSRFTEYRGGQFTHGQFTEWELQPLNEDMRLHLARHLLPILSDLLQITPPPAAEDFVAALKQDTRIAAWGENPLLFSLTAIAYTQKNMLPGYRAGLYRDIVTLMLTARTPDQREREELSTLLADVALQLYQTWGRNFTLSDLLALLTRRSPESSLQAHTAMITRILDSGLLDVVAYQTYGFKHQMFQEYLAASALARTLASPHEEERKAGWEFAWRKHIYSRWNEILRLCVGVLVQDYGTAGREIAARWLHALADEQTTVDGDVGNLCLELAVGSLREFSSALHSGALVEVTRVLLLTWANLLLKLRVKQHSVYLHQERLGRLIEDVKMLDLHLVLPTITWLEGVRDHGYQGLDADDVANFIDMLFQELTVTVPAKVLAHAFPDSQGINLFVSTQPATLQTYGSLEHLILLLQDKQEHWRVRAGAAQLLGAWEEKAASVALCNVLTEPCYYLIQVAAIEALGKHKERIPIELLLPLLQDDNEYIRAATIETLANVGARLPIEPFLAALDNARSVRTAISVALEKLGEQIAPEPLLRALYSENEVGRATALSLLGSRTPYALLLTTLEDPSAHMRRAAVEVVGKLGERIPVILLQDALHDQDTDVRIAAVVAIGASREAQATELLFSALKDSEVDIHFKAHKAIIQTDRGLTSEKLIYLADEKEMPGSVLALALPLHIELPVEMLLAALENPRVDIVDNAASLLADLGERAPIATLLTILNGTSPRARLGAAQALSSLAPYVPIEPIFEVLQNLDADSAFYNPLVLLLLRSGAIVPTAPLLNALHTEWHGRYREKDMLVTILGDMGAQAPIKELLNMLPDGTHVFYEWQPAGRAAQALRSVVPWITPDLLRATAQHRSEDEYLALNILEAMGKDAPLDLFMNILNDETRHHGIRSAARSTLHEVGVHLPLKYFLAEAGQGQEGTDYDTIAMVRELGPQAPIAELLDLLISNYKWRDFPSLLERTGNNDDWVHDTVIDALREITPYLPLDMLIETLDHPNPLARKGAVRVLGAFGERAPIDKLIAILHNTKEVLVVRAVTLTTLAELQPYTPVEALIAVLHDQNVHIRRFALWYLEKWDRDIPLEPLLALIDDDEYDLHDDAIQALGWLQDHAPVESLLSLLDSDDEDEAENASIALSNMGKYAPVDALIAHLYDNDGDMRSFILDALADLGENAPIELIMQALDNEDANVRSNAEYALGQIVEAVPAKLVAFAQHDHRTPVRKALMRALAKMDTDAPIELAFAALEDENEDVRLYARIALVEQNVDATRLPIEPLLHALIEHRRSEYDSHWSELDLLARCGASVPIEPLLVVLGNSRLSICKNAAAALYKTHPEAFTEVAKQAEAILRGEPTGSVFASRVQSRIAEHVKLIGRAAPEVIAMISDLLDWPYWEVRMKAAQALGAIHRSIPDRAIKRLMELRHDPETQAVREAADEALAEILSYENGIEDE